VTFKTDDNYSIRFDSNLIRFEIKKTQFAQHWMGRPVTHSQTDQTNSSQLCIDYHKQHHAYATAISQRTYKNKCILIVIIDKFWWAFDYVKALWPSVITIADDSCNDNSLRLIKAPPQVCVIRACPLNETYTKPRHTELARNDLTAVLQEITWHSISWPACETSLNFNTATVHRQQRTSPKGSRYCSCQHPPDTCSIIG